MRQLRKSLAGLSGRLTLLCVLSCVAAGLEAATLGLLVVAATNLLESSPSIVVDLRSFGGVRTFSLAQLFTLMAVVIVTRLVVQVFMVRLDAKLTSDYEASRRNRVIDLFFHSNWEMQSREKGGRLQVLFTENVAHGIRALHALNLGIIALANFAILLFAALLVNPLAVLAIVVLAGVLFAAVKPVFSYSRRRAIHKSAALTELATTIHQAAAMVRDARVFNVVDAFQVRIKSLVDEVRRSRAAQQLTAGILPAVYQSIVLLVVVAGLAMLRGSSADGVESLGTAVLLLVRAMSYSQSFQSVYHQIVESLPYLERLDEFEDECRAAAVSTAGEALPAIESLTFENVDFAYLPGEPVLKDLSFSVARGECIGIVGPSGSGKSTLIQLLLRLRDADSGRILVNGQSAERYSLGSWYDHVSIVPQEPILLRESITDNIRFFRNDISSADVERAAREAGIYDEIAAMPQAFDTPAGERGNNLSGGQRQRVCIARALVGRPDVIIFDEPTSALDAHSEAHVLRSLDLLKGRVTVFIIAHRLSTLNICDKVMVLRDGELQDFAAPAVLAEQNPYYAEALQIAKISG